MNNLVILASVENWGERWENFTGTGIQTFILGMVTVFAVLAILWGCLEIFRYVFYTIPERNKANGGEKPAPAPKAEPAPEPVAYSDDGEVVAAIIAAITAMRNDEAAESGVAPGAFRVVSFRKRH